MGKVSSVVQKRPAIKLRAISIREARGRQVELNVPMREVKQNCTTSYGCEMTRAAANAWV